MKRPEAWHGILGRAGCQLCRDQLRRTSSSSAEASPAYGRATGSMNEWPLLWCFKLKWLLVGRTPRPIMRSPSSLLIAHRMRQQGGGQSDRPWQIGRDVCVNPGAADILEQSFALGSPSLRLAARNLGLRLACMHFVGCGEATAARN